MIQTLCNLLEQISLTASRNAKIQLLTENLSEELFFLFETALDPYLTYGIEKFDDGKVYRQDIPELYELRVVRQSLSQRQITGNDARDLLRQTLLVQDPIVRKWLIAIFQKNLRAGVSTETIQKIFPDRIRQFKIQLCDKAPTTQEFDSNWIVEPKLDGLRCIMIFKKFQCIDVLSRGGRPLYNVGHITSELEPYIEDGVLDGELLGVDWNDSIGVVRSSKTKKKSATLKFYAFDFIPIRDWEEQKCEIGLLDRRILLERKLSQKLLHTRLLICHCIVPEKSAWDWAREYHDAGYEGAVVKRIGSSYVFDRSKDWLKLKFEETLDLEVVDTVEGTGRNRSRLGALVCKLPNRELVHVGGGYSKEQRRLFWEQKSTLLGRVIEVKFQETTKGGKSLRFPIFLRFRLDKEWE